MSAYGRGDFEGGPLKFVGDFRVGLCVVSSKVGWISWRVLPVIPSFGIFVVLRLVFCMARVFVVSCRFFVVLVDLRVLSADIHFSEVPYDLGAGCLGIPGYYALYFYVESR